MFGTIQHHAGKLGINEEWLRSHDLIELQLSSGEIIPAEWYEDPRGRPAVFLQFDMDDGSKFKSVIYLPVGIKARRLNENNISKA